MKNHRAGTNKYKDVVLIIHITPSVTSTRKFNKQSQQKRKQEEQQDNGRIL
jgi:hypothetical protein